MSNEYETWKAYAENLHAQRENDADTIAQMAIELGETRQERDHFRAMLEGVLYPPAAAHGDEAVYQVMYLGLDGGGWIDVDLQTMESHARYPETFQTRTLWTKKEEK